jgi:hypothetical protein
MIIGVTDEYLDSLTPVAKKSQDTGNRSQKLTDLEGKHGLPAGILSRVLKGESSGPNSVSPKGATGEFQLMPTIARAYGVKDTSDFDSSAQAAARMLSDALKVYSNKYPNLDTAQTTNVLLAHYNGGWTNGNNVARTGNATSKETQKYLGRVGVNPADTRSSPSGISDQELDALTKKTGGSAADAFRVGSDSAINALTAGFYRKYAPEGLRIADSKTIAESPVSETAGSIIGTVPYMFIPGGVPVQAAVLGARGATQAYNEGQDAAGIITSGGLEAAAPVVGAAVGTGLKMAGRGVRATGNRLFTNPPDYIADFKIAGQTETGVAGALRAGINEKSQAALTAAPVSKQEIGKTFVENIKNSTGFATVGGVIGAQQSDNPYLGAATGAVGAGVIKAAFAKTMTELFPRIAPETTTRLLKYLPSEGKPGDFEKFANFWIDARIAAAQKADVKLSGEIQSRLAKLPPNASVVERAKATKDITNKRFFTGMAAERDVKKFYESEARQIFDAAQKATETGIKRTAATARGISLAGASTLNTAGEQQRQSRRTQGVTDEYLDGLTRK